MGSRSTARTLTWESPGQQVSFEVSHRCDWLAFRFDYDRPRTWVHLNVWDPLGRLRYTHLDFVWEREAVLHVDPYRTSDMGVAGTIPSGQWTVSFVFKTPVLFRLEWETGDGDGPEKFLQLPQTPRRIWSEAEAEAGTRGYSLNRFEWEERLETGSRWYKGDFHTHTRLSDGKMSPEQNTIQAVARGLDFFAATDHNLLATSWPEGQVLVIPGIEFTSKNKGHWNAIGLKGWLDWGKDLPEGGEYTQEAQNRLMEEAGALGAIRSINHPLMAQFSWTYMETPLAYLDTLEICNSPNCHGGSGFTEKALALWGSLWQEGYRTPGIGGSDTHLLPTDLYADTGLPSWIGDPANYVYADHLSAAAILEATRAGRVYVSRGPVLNMLVSAGERHLPFPTDVTPDVDASGDGRVHWRISVSGAEGAELILIENGERMGVQPIREAEQTFELAFDWKGKPYVWARVDIRSKEGELLTYTNPLSYGTKQPDISTWGELLARASLEPV